MTRARIGGSLALAGAAVVLVSGSSGCAPAHSQGAGASRPPLVHSSAGRPSKVVPRKSVTAPSRSSSPPLPSRSPSASPVPTHTPSSRPSPRPKRAPTKAQLRAALLTVGELPGTGWTSQPNSSSPGPKALKKCKALSAGQRGVTAQVAVSFSDGGTQPDGTVKPYVSEGLIQNSVAGAKQMVGAFATIPRTCGPYSLKVQGVQISITITTEPFSRIGDEAAELKVTISAGQFSAAVGEVIAIRHGGTVILVTDAALPLHSGLTRQVAVRAYRKVAARW